MRVNFDVLMILDALDRHGSFATAAESLYKTPAALSYMICPVPGRRNKIGEAKMTDLHADFAGGGGHHSRRLPPWPGLNDRCPGFGPHRRGRGGLPGGIYRYLYRPDA